MDNFSSSHIKTYVLICIPYISYMFKEEFQKPYIEEENKLI